MGRRRKENPKRNQLCLRLTDLELEILKAYTVYKGYDKPVDSLRALIVGIEDWMKRQREKKEEEEALAKPPPLEDVERQRDAGMGHASLLKSLEGRKE
jgi:hypothetical protein